MPSVFGIGHEDLLSQTKDLGLMSLAGRPSSVSTNSIPNYTNQNKRLTKEKGRHESQDVYKEWWLMDFIQNIPYQATA